MPLAAEGEWEPGAEDCPTCGGRRIPVVEASAQPVPYAEPVEVTTRASSSGDTVYSEVRQGPFVFRQYTRTYTGRGPGFGGGCGCGCLLLLFLLFLIIRGLGTLF
jgi:hypothetical protein